mgnify:CR=1 FL=1
MKLFQNYLKKHNVPFLTYESFGIYDSKTWGMELTESLGYPYIPSVVTTKLNPRILAEIKDWGYPLIVKNPTLDRGTGVNKVDNETQLKKEFRWNSTQMMIQKMIPNVGDFRLITMKNKMQLIVKRKVTSKTKGIIIVHACGFIPDYIFELKQFCKENNLQSSKMSLVASGIRKHHKKYLCEKLG